MVDDIIESIRDFFDVVLGRRVDDYDESDDENSGSEINFKGIINGASMLIILDTAHLMDEASWRLLHTLKLESCKLGVILLLQTDTNNNPKIHPDASDFYHETFAKNSELLKLIDLAPLK